MGSERRCDNLLRLLISLFLYFPLTGEWFLHIGYTMGWVHRVGSDRKDLDISGLSFEIARAGTGR